MKLLMPVAICTLLLVGCGPGNYDECVLSEIKGTSGARAHYAAAESACRNRFPYIGGKNAKAKVNFNVNIPGIPIGRYEAKVSNEFLRLSKAFFTLSLTVLLRLCTVLFIG